MKRYWILVGVWFATVAASLAAQRIYDDNGLQRQYDAGYRAGYDKGVDAWPSLDAQMEKTGVCKWARFMIKTPICGDYTVGEKK